LSPPVGPARLDPPFNSAPNSRRTEDFAVDLAHLDVDVGTIAIVYSFIVIKAFLRKIHQFTCVALFLLVNFGDRARIS